MRNMEVCGNTGMVNTADVCAHQLLLTIFFSTHFHLHEWCWKKNCHKCWWLSNWLNGMKKNNIVVLCVRWINYIWIQKTNMIRCDLPTRIYTMISILLKIYSAYFRHAENCVLQNSTRERWIPVLLVELLFNFSRFKILFFFDLVKLHKLC